MSGKILFWDTETSNLNADFGFIIAGGGKYLGDKKLTTFSISDYGRWKDNPTDDKILVRDFAKYLSEADLWVTWYGQRFDVPFVNSRLVFHGYSPLPPIPHVDLWRVSRFQLHIHSNRLASASAFLGLEDKTRLDGPTWIRAAAGHRPSIAYVKDHCIQDIEVLAQAYEKMRPLILNGPNVGIILTGDRDRCPNCGGPRQRRGFRVTPMGKKQRFQCVKCGGWSTGNVPREAVIKRGRG